MTEDKMNNQFVEKSAQLWTLPEHSHKVMDTELAMSIAKELESEYLRGRETALSEQSALLDEFAMTLRGLKNFSSPELREFIQKSLDKYESRVDNNGKTE